MSAETSSVPESDMQSPSASPVPEPASSPAPEPASSPVPEPEQKRKRKLGEVPARKVEPFEEDFLPSLIQKCKE